ncbi:MAG: hypothetical protein GY937_13415 [bacterium]|nr:hypothetical protein [bacterium]
MKRLLVGFLLIAAGAGAWYLPHLRTMTEVGAGYVAKQACSCVFVAERSLASCRADMLASMESIEAEVLVSGEGVRAWVPLLADRTALHEAPYGCTLGP